MIDQSALIRAEQRRKLRKALVDAFHAIPASERVDALADLMAMEETHAPSPAARALPFNGKETVDMRAKRTLAANGGKTIREMVIEIVEAASSPMTSSAIIDAAEVMYPTATLNRTTVRAIVQRLAGAGVLGAKEKGTRSARYFIKKEKGAGD